MKDYSLIKALYGSARQLAFKRIIPHVNHITHTQKNILKCVLRPFQEYFIYAKTIIMQRWAKTGAHTGKHLNLALLHAQRLEHIAVRNLMFKSQHSYPLYLRGPFACFCDQLNQTVNPCRLNINIVYNLAYRFLGIHTSCVQW